VCLSVRARPCTCEREPVRVLNFLRSRILFFLPKKCTRLPRPKADDGVGVMTNGNARIARVSRTFDAEKNAIDVSGVRRYRIIIITRVVKTKLSRCGRAVRR